MTAFRVGDIPANPTVLVLDPDLDVTGYNAVSAVLTDPTGATVVLTGATFTLGVAEGVNVITVAWGTPTRFTVPGLYQLALALTNTGKTLGLPNVPVIVEKEDGWLTISSIRRLWRDAPDDDEDVFELLEVSKAAVVAFAPVLADTDPVPANYRKGQRMQARNVWNASKVDPSNGSLGDDTFVIRPVPLDWQVKQVLRPKPALPWVG